MTTAFVYLAFDIDGTLLYVGHTEQTVERRMKQHGWGPKRSTWLSEVNAVDFVEVGGYPEALQLERELIAELGPLHNVQGQPRLERAPS